MRSRLTLVGTMCASVCVVATPVLEQRTGELLAQNAALEERLALLEGL